MKRYSLEKTTALDTWLEDPPAATTTFSAALDGSAGKSTEITPSSTAVAVPAPAAAGKSKDKDSATKHGFMLDKLYSFGFDAGAIFGNAVMTTFQASNILL